MPFGDVGGAVTELIITCRTELAGEVAIGKGDALALVDDYTVTNEHSSGRPVFGEAMAARTENDVAIPVKVRGISVFGYTGYKPVVNGTMGVVMDHEGSVRLPTSNTGTGIVLKVDETAQQVHVLL